MAGRRPKPTAVRKAEGNPGKRSINEAEPQFADAQANKPPKGIKGQARETWKRLAPELARAGVLKYTDRDLLESYCRLYAYAAECWKQYDGTPVVNTGGKIGANPYAKEGIAVEKELSRLRSELGLSPTARVRLKVTEPPKTDDLDDFLKFTG